MTNLTNAVHFSKRSSPHHNIVYPDISWLLILPLGVWGIATVYVPILGASVTTVQTWIVTLLIIALISASLFCHVLGHLVLARLMKVCIPEKIPVFIFGDAAQIWPPALSFRQDVLTALAGPLTNLVLAGLAYLAWNAQVNVYLNLVMPFVGIFNLWLAIINIAPVYPFDGGRIFAATVARLSTTESVINRALLWIGYLACLAEIGWGFYLIAQNVRFGLATGIATIFIASISAYGLLKQPVINKDHANSLIKIGVPKLIRPIIMESSFLVMAGIAACLLMTNNGIEAPGPALSVEPMVEVPAQYRHQPAGTFILTSVIQQSPVPAGLWALARTTPVYKILPPEKIAPNQPSPQESARQGFQMLDQSETTAAVVGLRLAGYDAKEVGKGAGVSSILSNSPAKGILLPGDIITAFNGIPIHFADDLINQVKAQNPGTKVHLSIIRDQRPIDFTVPLMSPSASGGSPRIGIAIQDAGFDYSLPIPVKIVPQKIVGGPSAGLMFTLTVYNLLNARDLTGGWKIAGTGTINPDGSVGPIGGVQQKVAAAEAAGAVYFLCPADNYVDALSVARRIKVVKVKSVEDALTFLNNLSQK